MLLDALGYDGWKSVKDYGKRWLVEITFLGVQEGTGRDAEGEEIPQPEGQRRH